MNIRDLEYLVALEELKHFRKAAEKCFVSQPTLSGQIRKLEDELGVLLMERSSRKVLFTQAGLDIAAKARKVLLDVKQIKEAARSYSEPMNGPLHVGLIPTVAPYLLPAIVPPMRQAFPDLDVYLYENQTHVLLRQLEEGELDCLILALLPGMEGYGHISLYHESLELVIPQDHKWANQPEINLSNLEGERVLMLEDGHCLRDQAMGFCFTAGADEDTTFKATSLETLRHMVSSGIGITLLPRLAVPKGRSKDGLVYVPFTEPKPAREIVLLYRKNSVRRPCFNELGKLIKQKISKRAQ
ncbi:DNA-binding transcriptional regulator OxyR [Motilimonas eburnea]|uniref:DNA-binding transcriptional regulator OxyR n=1 Tax=Motilimonas eburnea TaxID=1737488 RepID=UPI001E5C7C1A|nr:DNA-binding transcriptional regulator OxyR [Motilimonas eburnea]MCE2570777.1 DNA-binding transcriptional regulator OxyR [Motilimonas eburnea]